MYVWVCVCADAANCDALLHSHICIRANRHYVWCMFIYLHVCACAIQMAACGMPHYPWLLACCCCCCRCLSTLECHCSIVCMADICIKSQIFVSNTKKKKTNTTIRMWTATTTHEHLPFDARHSLVVDTVYIRYLFMVYVTVIIRHNCIA